tara:strand:+ start:375 stop:647 length:273 start_codon:yes stop_codon:yes gene_type:complete
MDNSNIYNIVVNNPIYLAVTVVLSLLLIYSVLKKFIKLIFIALFCILIYIGYLYFTGDPKTVEDVDAVLKTGHESIDNIEELIKDNINNE